MKLLLLALLSLPLVAVAANSTLADRVWLMFFMKGSVQGSKDEGEQKQRMDGHFANMKKQVELGRLLTAGPLKDPTQQRRGITVLVAQDRKSIDSYFETDPFVKAGIMTVDAAEWKVPANKFDPTVDPSSIIEFRLILFTRGKGMSPENKSMRRAHEDLMRSFSELGASVWGTVGGMQGIREALIVEGNNEAAIKAKLEKDPLTSHAILEAEIVPLWMSKGTVKN